MAYSGADTEEMEAEGHESAEGRKGETVESVLATLQFDEEEICQILSAERETSIGFDYDNTLTGEREQALKYYKGQMDDMPALDNRSKVVSTDVADGIGAALPDLIDVFLAGDDGITFQASGQEDEDLAKQETDYIRHVIFQQNRGFKVFYTAFKDALLSKVGVFKYYWEGEPEFRDYTAEVDEEELQELEQMGIEIVDVAESAPLPEVPGIARYRVTCRKMVRNGMVKVDAIAPEDFTVASDTVELEDTTYCAARRRSRVQTLLADGYDPAKVETLGEDEGGAAELLEQARDTAGEHSESEFDNPGIDALRQVEVIEHYIRIDLEGTGKPQIWRIVTGNGEACILDIEKRPRIEFAAITPYPMTHRFYGESLADKLMEIQRWKTALIRLLNDSGYFAMNQRVELNVNRATEDTMAALVDNTPGRPIPTKGEALKPITAGSLSFDVLAAIEFANTVAEQRTGVVRNAQGLKPDTLHDTFGGAMVLISAAQKQIRLIARIFAETGVRDLYLGVHDLLRSNATMKDTFKLRNKWVEVRPNEWDRRKDVSVEIGIGSGGREEKIMKYERFADRLAGVVEAQGGMNGPVVTLDNIYRMLDAYGDALDIKAPERFITDPAEQPPQQEGEDPDQAAAAAELQLEAQKAAETLKLKKQEMDLDAQARRYQADLDAQLQRESDEREHTRAIWKMEKEAELAEKKALAEAAARMHGQSMNLPENRPGGSLAE